MASVNFKKLKGNDVKAMLRHCDSAERLKHNHKNQDIDKSRTKNNINYSLTSRVVGCMITELDIWIPCLEQIRGKIGLPALV